MSFIVDKDTEGAKLAKLDYEVIKEKENSSIVKVTLHTGRHHQIRLQFSNIGHPLVGDAKYGNDKKGRSEVMLWANSLEFKHPTKDEVMKFEILPSWME